MSGPSELERAAGAAAAARDAALAPLRRQQLGAVHTPPELAGWVVRRLDRRVRACGVASGLVDPDVALVDPACGPGMFFAAALGLERRRGRAGPWLGLDLDPAALAQADAVLRGPAATADWITLRHADTLTLDPGVVAAHGERVVVLGNPPWRAGGAVRAAARRAPLEGMLDDFRRDALGPLRERKLGVLSDLYVRFWRWAAEVVRRAAGGGAVAFVSNASFLDGPVHRGMRYALARWFDRIEVLDLGGNARLAGGGRTDANLFAARTGVCAVVAERFAVASGPGGVTGACARVRYARLWGGRAAKLAALAADAVPEAEVVPLQAPWYRFAASRAVPAGYARHVSLDVALPFHREGVQTNRDAMVIDGCPERLVARLEAFARGGCAGLPAAALRPSAHYRPERARARLAALLDEQGVEGLRALLRPLAYRPLDTRWFLPLTPLCHRPRALLSRAIAQGGLALLSVRKDRGAGAWRHVAASQVMGDACYLSTRSSCRTRAFPSHAPDGAENLSPEVREGWADRLGCAIDARRFIHYALAVLASRAYQARFAAVLQVDYARVPEPRSAAQLVALSELGAALAAELATPAPVAPPTSEGDGWATLATLRFDPDQAALEDGAGELRVPLKSSAHDLVIGHIRVVPAYLAAHAREPLTPAWIARLRDVCARAERVVALLQAIDELTPSPCGLPA